MRSALIVGATGLVGNSLLEQILDDPAYDHVTILARKALQIQNAKFHGVLAHFEKLEDASVHFDVDDVFCCLGTTISKAGSQAAFRKIDFDYVVHSAKLASHHPRTQFLVVSSLGANPASTNFYSRVKGEMEEELLSLGLPALHIFRPSLLLGHRSENRPGERIAQAVFPILRIGLVGPLRKYRAISAETVARAMIRQAKQGLSGLQIYESDVIQSIADTPEKTN